MTATYNNLNQHNAQFAHCDKIHKYGLTQGYKVITIAENKAVTLVELNIAHSKSGVVYACLWAGQSSGSGVASGCGYHKASAATAEAIDKAGYTLSKGISGVGDTGMEEALIAIAKSITTNSVYLISISA